MQSLESILASESGFNLTREILAYKNHNSIVKASSQFGEEIKITESLDQVRHKQNALVEKLNGLGWEARKKLVLDIACELYCPYFDPYEDYGSSKLSNVILAIAESLQSGKENQINEFFVNNNNIGLILIRPEMAHIEKRIVGFLEELDFVIMLNRPHNMLIEQYLSVYKKALGLIQTKYTFPNRTLVYLNAPSQLVVFSHPHYPSSDRHPQDEFLSRYKGKQGRVTPRTIRGDLVYHEAKKQGLDRLPAVIDKLAFDPLGVYGHHTKRYNKSLMAYTSVSVHIPNSRELSRDAGVLLEINDFEKIRCAA
jgi:hypothetical protein